MPTTHTTTSLSEITKTYNGSAQAASGATAKLSSNSASAPSAAFTYKYYTNDACSAVSYKSSSVPMTFCHRARYGRQRWGFFFGNRYNFTKFEG